MRFLVLLLAGCPWVGQEKYDADVRDVDQDGVEAIRFGGDDCDDSNPNVVDCDEDNDGFLAAAYGGQDCNDTNPQINPDAPEACDGIDNDCDGLVDGRDDVDPSQRIPFFPDADEDGYGDLNADPTLSCDVIPGFVTADLRLDCNDSAADVNPNEVELCDAIDHDCDGDPTAGAINPTTWYADLDGDGARDDDPLTVACEAPPGALSDIAPVDCDDDDASAAPGNAEIYYNDVDNDCLGGSDHDADLDGFDAPSGGGNDCNDDPDAAGDAFHPDAPELCDTLDNDCDGEIDEPEDLTYFQYWLDNDQDGTGNLVIPPVETCQGLHDWPGYVANDRDCDDADADRNLDADEVCDGKDNDCDGLIDDDDDSLDSNSWLTFYADSDGDGYGRDDVTAQACAAPAGYAPDGGDCNDDLPLVNPSPFTDEFCNTIDDDCDGEVDEGAVDAGIFYLDADEDGFGNGGLPVPACNANAPGIASNDDDCNDTDGAVYPGAPEICGDSVRQDCQPLDPADCDGDGVVGTDAGGSDCDDTNPDVSPLASEVCDGVDNDCDGLVDDLDTDVDLSTARDWYVDGDGDGVGAGAGEFACQPPSGRVSEAGDCDDADPDRYPGAVEVCDSKDNDCNGPIDDDPQDPTAWYADGDGDGFGDATDVGYLACAPTGGSDVADASDCNDDLATVNPSAEEVCDGVDNDCSGEIDDDATGALTFYLDNDLDGFGSASLPILACAPGAGIVANDEDCNDTDPLTHPGAVEICYDNQRQDCTPLDLDDCDSDGFIDASRGGSDCDDATAAVNPDANEVCDGLDNDCNGLTDSDDPAVDLTTTTEWYLDDDDDGYGAPGTGVSSCGQPAGRVLDATDCDDDEPTTHPGADELCDGIDNDCEGGTDETPVVGAPGWFLDADGDQFGTGTADFTTCDPPTAQHVAVGGDCDDDNATTFPGADEVCDAVDNDCDGVADDNPINGSTYWADADGDGYGAASQAVQSCGGVVGLVTNPDDCNDAAAGVNPGAVEICYDTVRQDCAPVDLNDCDADGEVAIAFGGADCEDENPDVRPGEPEICDGLDNDCNGLLDEDDPAVDLSTTTTWYLDGDDDGYGGATSTEACSQPADHVLFNGDCNDAEPTAFPGGSEICDGLDNDCDGAADDADLQGPLDPIPFYPDVDGDGFGVTLLRTDYCVAPDASWVADDGDCNDSNLDVFPGATETCDGGVDNDCDGLSDDADPGVQGQTTWYADNDGDGYPVTSSTLAACNQPPGYAALAADDCNDNSVTVNPGASEICNAGIDDDCNGLADLNDPGLTDASEWYRDVDGDNYGTGAPIVACNQPPGYAGNDLDCDDQSNAVNPAAAEVCDAGIDNDCNGLADDADPSVTQVTSWYLDDDGDTFGSLAVIVGVSPVQACEPPTAAYVLNNDDCLDDNAAVNPDALEICDGLDNDCNLFTDDNDPNLAGANTWYPDSDGDGFGANDVTGTVQCSQPTGTVLTHSDCNDAEVDVRPGATEICNGGIDDDCDNDADDEDSSVVGTSIFYADFDGDTYAFYTTTINACVPPAGYISNPGTDPDCNDNNFDINPGALEVCDGADNDCDTEVDADDADLIADTFYQDSDVDGFGNPNVTLVQCGQPAGYTTVAGDCDDTNTLRNPDADEVCDSLDNDCDNLIDDADSDTINVPTWYPDNDGDTFGLTSGAVTQCTQPAGYISTGGDCVDNDSDIRPDQVETCNDIDDDCDGDIDDEDSLVVGGTTFYADSDGDGYANYTTTTVSCDQPSGFIPNPGTDPDCNDNNVEVNPGAQEICNQGLDDDCDGDADAADSDVDASDWYQDADGDGFGDATSSQTDCAQPVGYVANDADCNDLNPGVFPGSIEACDGVDNDCDGDIDDADASVVGQTTYYPDADGDNFGDDLATGVARCIPNTGEVPNNTDCDDSNASISPASLEVCNSGVDDNCNGLADDSDAAVFGQGTYWPDVDGDGFGDATATAVSTCEPDPTDVTNGQDCDDDVSAVNPGALEVCNGGVDDDCDGNADDSDSAVFGQSTFWPDVDGDGFGDENAAAVTTCSPDPTDVTSAGDCDDSDASVNPTALEVCNVGVDDDCDGLIDNADDDVFGRDVWVIDNDDDGWVDFTGTFIESCGEPGAGDYANIIFDGDCDDSNANVNPSLSETYYDGVDNDCDLFTRDNDQDGDGVVADMATGGFPDCDDLDGSISPRAPEQYYDGIDNDCDAATVDNDQDGDGYTASMAIGDYGAGRDCNDTDASAYPGKPTSQKVWYDGVDDLCDGNDYDQDGDGQAVVDAAAIVPYAGSFPSGVEALDCADTDGGVTGSNATFNATDDDEVNALMEQYCGIRIELPSEGGQYAGGWNPNGHGYTLVGTGSPTSVDASGPLFQIDVQSEGPRPTLHVENLVIANPYEPFTTNEEVIYDWELVDLTITGADPAALPLLRIPSDLTVTHLSLELAGETSTPLFDLHEVAALPDRVVDVSGITLTGDDMPLVKVVGPGTFGFVDLQFVNGAPWGEVSIDAELFGTSSSLLVSTVRYTGTVNQPLLFLQGTGTTDLHDIRAIDVEPNYLFVGGGPFAGPSVTLRNSVFRYDALGTPMFNLTQGAVSIENSFLAGTLLAPQTLISAGEASVRLDNTVIDLASSNAVVLDALGDINTQLSACQSVFLGVPNPIRFPGWSDWDSSQPVCSGFFSVCAEDPAPSPSFVTYDINTSPSSWDLHADVNGVLFGSGAALPCGGTPSLQTNIGPYGGPGPVPQ